MLDLLGIEFHYFFMYDIFSLITRFINLESLYDPTFFFIFCLIVLNKNRSFKFPLNLLNKLSLYFVALH